MNRILYDCIDVFLVVHMEDLLVLDKSEADHLPHLDILLSTLQD